MADNSSRRGAETGIYVVCNDNDLLKRINRMLRGRGVIGVSDAEGKFHYLVDGRGNLGNALTQVIGLMEGSADHLATEVPNNLVGSILRSVLIAYDFDMKLIGTGAIFEIVRRMVIYSDDYFRGVKDLYSIAGNTLHMSYAQIERDVRYAVKRSSLGRQGVKTSVILRTLADEVFDRLERIEHIKRQPA
ncbi:MAG: hypothetical protein IJ757_09490 [Clostridiales bacterium]|nr:hypothetical protein [Clostridiales bacterium]